MLRPRADFYASAHPGPAGILLIIEIAQSSIDYDREAKAAVYAKMGIAEYWLADLNENVLSCYSAPGNVGYRRLEQFHRGQAVSPQLLPACAIAVDVLPAE